MGELVYRGLESAERAGASPPSQPERFLNPNGFLLVEYHLAKDHISSLDQLGVGKAGLPPLFRKIQLICRKIQVFLKPDTISPPNSYPAVCGHGPDSCAARTEVYGKLARNISLNGYRKIYTEMPVDRPGLKVCGIIFRDRD